MKYLIKNKKEFTITITAVIVAILDLVKVATGADLGFNEDSILAIVSTIIGALIWFYNMPTSKENCEATGRMRLEKAQNKSKITGEDFREEE